MIVESYEEVVILSGKLFANHWETLHTAISLSLKRHPEGVIVDCSGIVEINERGALTFASIMDFLQQRDARIIVAAVPPRVMEVLRSVPDVRSQLPVVATVEEAKKSLYLLGESDPENEAKKRKPKLSSDQRLIVALDGKASDKFVMQTAIQIAEGLNSEVELVFPLIVPRELPLNAPLPEAEAKAKETLEAADALLNREKVDHEVLLWRARDFASAISEALEENPSQYVVVGVEDEVEGADGAIKKMRSAMTKLSTTLIFVRPSRD